MKTSAALIAAIAVLAFALLRPHIGNAQNNPPKFEITSLFPQEVTPARYRQVDPSELQALTAQGWELVAVTPFVYLNEERGGESLHPRPVVTQTYPAYFFKRLRPARF